MGARKLVFLLTEDWFFLSHFLQRALAAQRHGFDVLIAANASEAQRRIEEQGLRFAPIPFRRSAVGIRGEAVTLRSIHKLYRFERPDIVHHVGLKPILYGTLLAGRACIVNAPIGLGFPYSSQMALAKLLRPAAHGLMRLLLNPRASRVILENNDDFAGFVADGTIRREDAILIRGSGIDVDAIAPRPEPSEPIQVLLASRMLRDKGVGEFVEASRILRSQGRKLAFVLAGAPDLHNPTSVTESQLRAWDKEGLVAWLGQRSDVDALMAGSHIVVLPSYREGLPRVLLEAMAAGRPIVTTDVPGCREVVANEDNGLLVAPRDPAALAGAIARLADDAELRRRMGQSGRKRAEAEFSSALIVQQTLAVYDGIMQDRLRRPVSPARPPERLA